jgi:hypothetical protein
MKVNENRNGLSNRELLLNRCDNLWNCPVIFENLYEIIEVGIVLKLLTRV